MKYNFKNISLLSPQTELRRVTFENQFFFTCLKGDENLKKFLSIEWALQAHSLHRLSI